jgi:hypothetical protein
MGYTWSRLGGNVDNNALDNNPFGDNPGRDVYLYGLLKDDRRHDIRGSATWQATNWLSLGTTFSISSGNPYTKLYRNNGHRQFEDQRGRTGIEPRPQPQRSLRRPALVLPDQYRLNLKVVVNFRPAHRPERRGLHDVLNLLNTRTVTAVTVEEGPHLRSAPHPGDGDASPTGARYKF